MPGKKVLVSTALGQRPPSGEDWGREREEGGDAHKKSRGLDPLGMAGECSKGKSEICHLRGLNQ